MKLRAVLPRLSALIESMLWLAGATSLGLYAGIVLHQRALAQEAVQAFFAEQPASLPPDHEFEALVEGASIDPDQSLWSEARVESYRQNLETTASSALAVMRVPALNLEAPVFEGALDHELARGPGWIRGTAPINSDGNVALAGHRDGFFRALKDIETGDVIEVFGRESRVRYRVTETWIVDPDAVHVLDPTAAPSLTLVTCYPFYYVGSAPQRFIVRAVVEAV